ncbi:hypothetical protein LDENG_00242890 [Lucifuga dentata]|nr:hypothetical protein LDENG_00242890 [Lucifuga dentata]
MEEPDVTKFIFTLVTVKSEEDEEKVQSSQLHNQTEEKRESESVSSSSTEQIKRESDGEDCGGPEPARNTYPEMQQLLVQQVWSLSVNQEQPELLHVKEEQDERGISQQGEQLQHLEEADLIKVPFTQVPVKTEGDEDKVQSTQLQSQTEENREAENLASSSTQQPETGAHIEDCGGPGPSRNLDPGSDLQPPCDGSHTERRKKAFSCSVCGKNFTQSGHLKTHMRIHMGEKPFGCSLCSKTFTVHGHLKMHMRIHTGDKPFSCPLCGKHFTARGHMKTHMRIHTGEKPFSCSICGKSFIAYGHLTIHMRIHTGEEPVSCSICGKSFIAYGHLTIHMRIHTGEEPVSCLECGKTFKRRCLLKNHRSIHSKEEELSGRVCSQRFNQHHRLKIKCGEQQQQEVKLQTC